MTENKKMAVILAELAYRARDAESKEQTQARALALAELEVFSVAQIIQITGVARDWAYRNIHRGERTGGRLNPACLATLLDIESLDSRNTKIVATSALMGGTSPKTLARLTHLRERTMKRWLSDARKVALDGVQAS